MQQHPAYSEVGRGGGDIGIFDASKMSDDDIVRLFDASKRLSGDVNAYTIFDFSPPEDLAKNVFEKTGIDISKSKTAVRIDELKKIEKHPEISSIQMAHQISNNLDGFKFVGFNKDRLVFERSFEDGKITAVFDHIKDKNVLSLKTMYSDTGILPTALADIKTPRAWLNSATTQGSLPAKEILTDTVSKVNTQKVGVVVKGMFEAKGDGGVITLFKGSDVGTIFHESAHYFERTFTADERAAFDSVFGKFEEGVQRSEAFAEGFVKWVADKKQGSGIQSSLFKKWQHNNPAFAQFWHTPPRGLAFGGVQELTNN